MRNDKEIVGTLLGFDDFVSQYRFPLFFHFYNLIECLSISKISDMVLEDVTE